MCHSDALHHITTPPSKVLPPTPNPDPHALEGFQNLDESEDWKNHDPHFEWTDEELEQMALDEQYERHQQEAMAAWWDMDGVRCATFGRDPNKNPYRSE